MINSVSLISQTGNSQSFKGLWGSRRYKGFADNREFECHYYEMPYYPFADETSAEISANIKAKLEPMNKVDVGPNLPDIIAKCENTTAKIMEKLIITKEEYKQLTKTITKNTLYKLLRIF